MRKYVDIGYEDISPNADYGILKYCNKAGIGGESPEEGCPTFSKTDMLSPHALFFRLTKAHQNYIVCHPIRHHVIVCFFSVPL
jgi:hypothetical protein